MRASYLLTTALLISACGGETTANTADDVASETDVSVPGSCSGIATTLAPASDGQSDFYYRDSVVFSVTEGADSAEIRLTDSAGDEVTGETYVDDQVGEDEPLRVVFSPDRPLRSNSDYVAHLDFCGGSPSVNFRTSDLGTQVEDPDLLQGWTYVMDLSQARVVKPGTTAQALLTLLDNDLSLQIDNVSGDTLDITVAATDTETGLQDTCVPSLSFNMPGNFADAPSFKVGPIDVPFTLAGYTVVLYDGQSSATFASTGKYFAGGRLAGAVDARDIVAALSGRSVLPAEDPEALCDILAGANMPCEPCRDGERYCLNLEVDQISGVRSDEYLEPVNTANCHEDCATSCDNDECLNADDFAVCY